MSLLPDLFFAILLWSTYSRPPVFDPLLSDLPAGKLLGLPQVVGELKVVILKALKVVQLAHAETRPWETAISLSSAHFWIIMWNSVDVKWIILNFWSIKFFLTINSDNSHKINFGPFCQWNTCWIIKVQRLSDNQRFLDQHKLLDRWQRGLSRDGRLPFELNLQSYFKLDDSLN